MPALGERFRAAREARGLTLSEVAEQIRIRSVYLGAIEDENWSVIGAPVYIRGFLRTYARFLSIDPEQAVAAFNERNAASDAGQAAETLPSSRRASWGLKPFIWIASAIAVALIAFVVYNEVALQGQAPPAPVAMASPSQLPSPTPGAASAAPTGTTGPPAVSAGSPSPGPHTLSISLAATSWLRIAVDGNVSMEGTFSAGTRRTFRGRFALVRVGNAGGVQILVDGKPVGPLGKTGDVVERSFTL